MWAYSQSTGELRHNSTLVSSSGYSGHGEGRNNPLMQDIRGIGPIPRGKYQIGPAFDHEHLGPCVMVLIPFPETETYGRDLFRIHGNNAINDASHGCVIEDRATRNLIARSDDRVLSVIP